MGVCYIPPIRPDELYHHGIKGMHWGIRRYQNPDGTYTAAGKRHYDYKKSKQYVTGDDATKAKLTEGHNYTAKILRSNGSATKRIDHAVIEKGKDRVKLTSQAYKGMTMAGIGVTIGALALQDAIYKGKSYVTINNVGANEYARQLGGLNTVNGGYATGAGGIIRGKKIVSKVRR